MEKKGTPTILFLSPLPQSILCYDTVWSRLSGMANLVALDLPGFGRSEGGYEHMSFEAQSAFLEAFIDAQELEDVDVVAPDIAMPYIIIHRKHKVKSLMVGDGPAILPSADGSFIRRIVGSGFWRSLVRLNGVKTFIAGGMQLGYLHYSPTCDEIEDYVQSYAGRMGQVTLSLSNILKGKELTDKIESVGTGVLG